MSSESMSLNTAIEVMDKRKMCEKVKAAHHCDTDVCDGCPYETTPSGQEEALHTLYDFARLFSQIAYYLKE